MTSVEAANEPLTWAQIRERYPHQWIGVMDVETVDETGATCELAEVIYTDRSRSELENIQFDTDGKVRAIYTTPDDSAYISSVVVS